MGLSSNPAYGSFRRVNPMVFYVLAGAYIVWRVYRRFRLNVGRQKLQPRRMVVRLILFGLFIVFIILMGLQNPLLLLGFGGGILGGAALGFAGLKLTKFETTGEGHFYTPDTRIGMAISLLLVGRLVYRFAVMNSANTMSTASLASNHPQAMNSPLTFLIIGLTFGYYIVYNVGLLVHTHDKALLIPPVLPAAPSANEDEPLPS